MRVECRGRFTFLDQVPRRHFEEGRDGMGNVGCYCRYAEYAVGDGRQMVLVLVGVLVEVCRRVAIKYVSFEVLQENMQPRCDKKHVDELHTVTQFL
jgi:hypothetical protein